VDLIGAWLDLMPGGTGMDAAGRDLLGRWSEPHRRYHDVAHLTAILSTLDGFGASRPVRLAAWFHDAVYDPRRTDNEGRSARLAVAVLTWLGQADVAPEVARLVLVTAGHDPAPGDRDAAVLCDADLAVLAWPRREYDGYAAAIRAEYAHVPDETYRVGRADVLHRLLDLPALYRTPGPHAEWEAAARVNLGRELDSLR
jgi:predicted metal-dependent HD superfamily phosphohydrolase